VIPRKRLLTLVPIGIAAVGLLLPADAAAQRRGVRRAPVRTVIVGGYSRPFYPFFYDPFWSDWYGYPYRPYAPYIYRPGADLRIQVTPREAEVYIDGYLVGNVDDYDGVFQRLRVPYGEHQISVYREGYRTITEKMLFRPYESYNIKQPMQPIGSGGAAEPRPAPQPGAPSQPAPRRGAPPNAGYPDRNPDRNADRFGTVAIRVQPGDAAVFIDGERWDTAPGEDRLTLELTEGSHRVEIRKEGFKDYSSTITVRAGRTVTLNVSLPSGG
jgi:hypothetical protein